MTRRTGAADWLTLSALSEQSEFDAASKKQAAAVGHSGGRSVHGHRIYAPASTPLRNGGPIVTVSNVFASAAAPSASSAR